MTSMETGDRMRSADHEEKNVERSETVDLTDDEDVQNVGNEDTTMTFSITIWKKKVERENEALISFVSGILTGLDIVGLIIGGINFNTCPADPKIPIFLIVIGVTTIVSKLITNCKNKLNVRKEMTKSVANMIGCIECFLHLTSIIFFILGSIWTYRIYQPSYDEHDIIYCNKTCYLYSFIYITLYYVVILSILFLPIIFLCGGICGLACCLACMTTPESVEQPENAEYAEESDFAKPHSHGRIDQQV